MVEKVSGIYLISDHTADKVYIGSSDDLAKRARQHAWNLENQRHPNKWLQSAFNRGNELVTTPIPLKESVILEAEQKLINEFIDQGVLYNIARDVVAPRRGVKSSEETKEKQRISMTGKKHTPETIEKLKTLAAGRGMPDYVIEAARIANTGKKHTEETRAKVSAASKSRMTPEARAHLSAVNKGIPHTPETIALLKEKAKGRTFSPQAQAARVKALEEKRQRKLASSDPP